MSDRIAAAARDLLLCDCITLSRGPMCLDYDHGSGNARFAAAQREVEAVLSERFGHVERVMQEIADGEHDDSCASFQIIVHGDEYHQCDCHVERARAALADDQPKEDQR